MLYIRVTLPALGGRTLAVRVFGFSDAEGWALGRALVLVLVAFPAWWAGVAGVAAWQWIGIGVRVGCAGVGAVDLRRHRPDWRALAEAEFVFLLAAAAVLWIRFVRPEILGQEKLMDLGIFASLLRAESFPPPDMWLAGATLPNYYWGARHTPHNPGLALGHDAASPLRPAPEPPRWPCGPPPPARSRAGPRRNPLDIA